MKRTIAAVLAATIAAAAAPTSAQSTWSSVQHIGPGTRIVIATTQAAPATRQFISADDSSLLVVDTEDSGLPPMIKKAVSETAADHPEYFTAARARDTFLLSKGIRIEPDGVYQDAGKVADRSALVVTIDRASIVSLSTADLKRGRAGCIVAGYGGWFVGGFVGAMAAIGLASGLGANSDAAGMTALFGGMIVGGSTGAGWAYRRCRNRPGTTIYVADGR